MRFRARTRAQPSGKLRQALLKADPWDPLMRRLEGHLGWARLGLTRGLLEEQRPPAMSGGIERQRGKMGSGHVGLVLPPL